VLGEVGQHHRDGLAHEPAAVDDQVVVGAQVEPRVFHREQFVARHVDRDLRVVPGPPGTTLGRSALRKLFLATVLVDTAAATPAVALRDDDRAGDGREIEGGARGHAEEF
jgi:hypothetical protein